MKKASYHQRQGQGKVFYPNYPRTNTTNRSRFCGLLLAGFFVFIMVFGVNPSFASTNSDTDGMGIIEPGKDDMVNQSGAYTTSIPIALPAARGNIGLSLALSYNSNSGNGKLGVGWGLSGIPAIVRTGKRKGAPKYNSADEFYYNGMKLIEGSEGIWHTERQSYLRIKEINDPYTSTSSRWEITSKNGTKMYLGGDDEGSSQGRIKTVGLSTNYPRVWSLHKMEDVDENTLRVYYGIGDNDTSYENYDTTNGDYYVEKIEYDGGGKIVFNWQSRTDTILSYRSSSKVEIDRKLNYFQTYRRTPSGTDYRINKYDLSYITSQLGSARALLEKVKVYGVTDSAPSVPDTVFTYQQSTTASRDWESVVFGKGAMPEFLTNPECQDKGVRFADVNGDGLMDVLAARDSPDSINKAHLGLGEEWGWNASDNSTWHARRRFIAGSGDDKGVRMADVNGDGLIDFIERNSSRNYTYLNDGSGWDDAGNFGTSPVVFAYDGGQTTSARFADVNGDGLMDILYSTQNDSSKIYLNTGTGWDSGNNFDAPPVYFKMESFINAGDTGARIVDLNGDGLPDIIGRRDGSTFDTAYLNTGTGWVYNANWKSPRDIVDDNGEDLGVRFADINGDGLTDMVKSYQGQSEYIWLNTGHGWVYENEWNDPPIDFAYSGGSDQGVRMIDANNDGMADIVVGGMEGLNQKMIYLNKGYIDVDKLIRIDNPLGGYTTITYAHSDYKNVPNKIATSIVVHRIFQHDGLGSGSFDSIYDFRDGYFDQSDREFRGFAKVVVNGPANITETHYYQDDVKKGLVKKTVTRDSSNRIYDYAYNHYTDYAETSGHYGYGVSGVHAPLLTQVDTYAVDGSTSTDSGTNPSGTTWKRMKLTMSYHDYGGPSTIENYGLVDEDGDDTGYDNAKTTFAYAVDTSYWVIKPYNKYVYGTNGQNSTYVTQLQERYYYDSGTGLGSWLSYGSIDQGRLKLIYNYTGSQWIYTESFGYDSYGNITKVKDTHDETTTIVYDNKYHMFPVKTTMPEVSVGTFSSYNYYDSYSYTSSNTDTISNYITRGRPVMFRNINGQFTKTYYDNLGRVTKVAKPGDSEGNPTIQYYYSDHSGQSDPSYVRTTLKDAYSGLRTYTYIDGLGRTVQTKKEALEGDSTDRWATVNTWPYYSGSHAITETGAPYFSSTSSFNRGISPTGGRTKTESYYGGSDYGKVVKLTAPDGTISYTYSQRLITKTRNARNYGGSSNLDGLGNVIQTKVYSDTYPYGTTYRTDKFYYNTGTGQLVKKVEDNGGENITTTMAYDRLGRNTSTIDPDSGTWDYYYDSRSGYTTSSGNLIGQRDAKGNETKLTYDAWNRLKRKDYPGGTDTYFYYDEGGSSDFENGMLTRVTDASGNTVINYDSRGRIKSEVKTISGLSAKTTSYSYDSMDRVNTIIYPGGESVKHTYLADGNLDLLGTSTDTDKYVDDIHYDAFGRTTYVDNGNEVETEYSYYDNTGNYRLYEIFVETPPIGGVLHMMIFRYSYDSVGNITDWNGISSSLGRDFTYDHLNRLTSEVDHVNETTINYAYNAINNITSKNGSSYSYYDGTHRVKTHGAYVYNYDANGNMTGKNRMGDTAYLEANSRYDYNHVGTKYSSKVYLSTPDDPAIVNYSWDMGDGNMLNGREVEYKLYSYRRDNGQYKSFPVTLAATFNDGSVAVKSIDINGYLCGDANKDSKVNILDATIVGLEWGKTAYPVGDPNYNDRTDRADLNNDGTVNILDAVVVGANWGYTATDRNAFTLANTYDLAYTFDSANNLTSISGDVNATYTYDHTGRRVKKVENGVTTYYINAYYEVEDGYPIKYYFANGQRIAKNDNGTLTYYHKDHLGSNRYISDSTGDLGYELKYKPYGETFKPYSFGLPSPVYKFTDKEEDPTGLYYYGARYYDPHLGRFISPDSYGGNYVYCNNNPVKYVDPDGNIAFVPVLILGATAAVAVLPPAAYSAARDWQNRNDVRIGVGGSLDLKPAKYRKTIENKYPRMKDAKANIVAGGYSMPNEKLANFYYRPDVNYKGTGYTGGHYLDIYSNNTMDIGNFSTRKVYNLADPGGSDSVNKQKFEIKHHSGQGFKLIPAQDGKRPRIAGSLTLIDRNFASFFIDVDTPIYAPEWAYPYIDRGIGVLERGVGMINLNTNTWNDYFHEVYDLTNRDYSGRGGSSGGGYNPWAGYSEDSFKYKDYQLTD